MSSLLIFIVFGVLILIHEAGHLVAAKRSGIRVEIFSLGMGKKLIGKTIGETDYRISLIPFGGYCKMAGDDPAVAKGAPDEFLSKPEGKRFWVIFSGSLTNYIFAFLLFSIIYMLGSPAMTNKVGDLLDGYPAEEAGIIVGDRITAINGLKTDYWDDILTAIQERSVQGEMLSVEVERGGNLFIIQVDPKITETKNIFGQVIVRPMVGIAPENEVIAVSYGIVDAVKLGWKKLMELTAMTYKMLWLILTGGMPVKSSLSGPIGIAYFIKKAANTGMIPVLIITAHISMALAIFNMLPFPILDGGHIVFLLIEKLRKRPVSVRIQEIITNIAFVVLITFALFVSFQDILRFTPIGKKMAEMTTDNAGSDTVTKEVTE